MSDKLKKALEKIKEMKPGREYEHVTVTEKPKPVTTSDHPPCADCGGIFFIRTGTCHACQTCGASQGCS